MKRCWLILMVCLLLAGVSSAMADVNDLLGQPFPDFTVKTTDGETYTLSEVLKEKEAVLVNFFATWCGPCEMEFPFIEEAYEEYADQVSVIALSVDAQETSRILQWYKDNHDLTFAVAPGGTDMANEMGMQYIPTSFMVDRFGNVGFVHVSTLPDAETAKNMFAAFLGDDYTQTQVFTTFPEPKAAESVEEASSDEGLYIVHVVDQNGNGVPKAYVNFCTDTLCQTTKADEHGLIEFKGEKQSYHVKVLKLPDGYTFDANMEVETSIQGDEITLEVTKKD